MRAALVIPLLLAACDRPADAPQTLDGLDNDLAAAAAPNAADPAIAAALHDPIAVDPQLGGSSNANAIRPPPRPDPGATPVDAVGPDPVDARTLRHALPATGCPDCRAKAGALTLGALAGGQRDRRTAGCVGVGYSAAWATRLPADLPLYPDAQVIEAAGSDAGACRLRVVSFATAAPPAKLVDWYYTRAAAAGWSAEHQRQGATQVLGGTRGEGAYVVYATPRPGGGADVDLLVDAAR